MSKVACQLINGTVAARSQWAEKMATQAVSVRCAEHNLFHSWLPLEGDDKRDANNKALAVRFDGYNEVTPGKWVLRDIKPTKKSKKGRKSVLDLDENDLS